MKKTSVIIIFLAIAAFTTAFTVISYQATDHHATCVGAKKCNACKNCKYCKHCSKDGKSCGVCK